MENCNEEALWRMEGRGLTYSRSGDFHLTAWSRSRVYAEEFVHWLPVGVFADFDPRSLVVSRLIQVQNVNLRLKVCLVGEFIGSSKKEGSFDSQSLQVGP